MKNQKGITLVALIITIVVMLILVAVSVGVVINSNLLGTAEKTVKTYENKSNEEKNFGDNVQITNGGSFADYVNNANL